MVDAAAEFWRFSLAVYARPGVAPSCLALQDRLGLDVNLLLFCCWAAARGHRLSPPEFAAALAASAPWQREIVEPLRRIRRQLNQPSALAAADAAILYDQAQQLELAAEEAEQRMLAAAVPFAPREVDDSSQASATAANLELYLGEVDGPPDEAAAAALALLAAACRPG
jgi:uncharacterized protein (TIGR02444 family)